MSKLFDTILDLIVPFILVLILYPDSQYSEYLGVYYYLILPIQMTITLILSVTFDKLIDSTRLNKAISKLKTAILITGVIATYVVIELTVPSAEWHEKIVEVDESLSLLKCDVRREVKSDLNNAQALAVKLKSRKMQEYSEHKAKRWKELEKIKCIEN